MPDRLAIVVASSAMVALAEAYRAAALLSEGDACCVSESTLGALIERGRKAHPELAVEATRFAAHLARCRAPILSPDVRAEDLFLACAAIGGDAAAVRKLQRECRPTLLKYLRSIDATSTFLDEVEQQAWEALLVGRENGPAKLAGYTGRGSLAGFVGVTAQRIALSGLRKQSSEGRAATEAAAACGPVLGDPEIAFLRAKHEQEFQAAVRDALATLGRRERLIYRMHLVDGLTVDRIAAAYGVSQSTVSRWLAKARATVIAEVRRLLVERLQVSETDLDSILGQMISRIDISASQILNQTPAPETSPI